MKKQISFPDIKDFKSAIINVTNMTRYKGCDEDNQPIYSNDPLPTLTFTGTVKLHGTNAGVCYNEQSGMWYQSRENIITPENDNAGFAFYADTHKDAFKKIIDMIASDNDIDLNEFTVSVYGEWAGKGIQKGVALNELDKAFYLFGVKISKPQDPEFTSYWVDSTKYVDTENMIFNVDMFESYSIDIDFNNPKEAADKMTEITLAVEQECPTSKARGVSGIGEGVVWRTEYKGSVIRFKVKGQKHSVVKTKNIVEIDPVKLNSISDFVDRTVTENRVNQGIEMTCTQPITKNQLGPFLKWIVGDITKEESHILAENGLEPKDVNKAISNRARDIFFAKYEEL